MTISFDTAKKLKEAGFPDPEHFYWQETMALGKAFLELCAFVGGKPAAHNHWGGRITPAPTADELLEALPIGYEKGGAYYMLNIHKTDTADGPGWSISYADDENDRLDVQTPYGAFSSLVEAAAYVWLELRKQGIV